MKKSIILGVLGVVASIATTYGQGRIALDNYDSTAHPLVTYGALTDGTQGVGLNSTYTIGLYWAAGNVVGTTTADPSGILIPTQLNAAFTLGTGSGSTGGFANSDTFNSAGKYAPATAFNPGLGEGATVTIMLIAYNNGSYANAGFRGHSTAFTMTTSTGTAFPAFSGDSETDGGFSVHPVPEPSIFALAGMGAAALMAFRRKK